MLCLVYAGNASRGLAVLALRAGCSPQWMPLLVGAIAWVPAVGLLVLTHLAPRPSAADVEARHATGAMSGSSRLRFARQWAAGLVTVVGAYAFLVGIRTLRDLYSTQIFAAALGVAQAPSWVFLAADAPGAVLSALALLLVGRVRDSRSALLLMQGIMAGAVLLTLGATALFQAKVLGGLEWQLLLGSGLYVCFALMGAPLFERLFAATRMDGTISYFVFLEDCCSYAVSISLLLYQDFAAPPHAAPSPPPLVDGGAVTATPASSSSSSPPPPPPRSNEAELQMFLRVLWGCGTAVMLLLLSGTAYFYVRLPRSSRAANDVLRE